MLAFRMKRLSYVPRARKIFWVCLAAEILLWAPNTRFFRLASTRCRCSSVDGFRTMAERKTSAGFMKRVHKPAMKRSATRRLEARLRSRLRMRN